MVLRLDSDSMLLDVNLKEMSKKIYLAVHVLEDLETMIGISLNSLMVGIHKKIRLSPQKESLKTEKFMVPELKF